MLIGVDDDDNLLLMATGIEQAFDVPAGDVLQKHIDVSYP